MTASPETLESLLRLGDRNTFIPFLSGTDAQAHLYRAQLDIRSALANVLSSVCGKATIYSPYMTASMRGANDAPYCPRCLRTGVQLLQEIMDARRSAL